MKLLKVNTPLNIIFINIVFYTENIILNNISYCEMYDKLVKEICVNVYDELSKYNIKGDDKKKFMEKICSVHINSIYNWKKEH